MTRRVYRPRPVRVELDRMGAGGAPVAVGRATVDSVREEWVIEDRWWTAHPLRRRYLELTTADGVNRVVFCDLESGRWFAQRGA
jgi:hypothetical protein